MSCPQITAIQRTECIGNSLTTINENFKNLQVGTCDNAEQINTLLQNIQNLDTAVRAVSGIVLQGAARAWCRFSGIKDTNNTNSTFFTDRYIFSSNNIQSVYRKALGDYRITFQTAFENTQYVVIGTSSEKASNGQFTWFQPYSLAQSYVDVKVHSVTLANAIDPDFVSVAIF